MPSEFVPPIYLFGDRAGQGRWEISHYRQHLRYINVLASRSPPVIIGYHNLLRLGDTKLTRRVWLNDHENVHAQLRSLANVTGIDLSVVDLDDPHEFSIWLDAHATEHGLIDQGLGLS